MKNFVIARFNASFFYKNATALSFKNAMFSRKACYFIGEMPEWERRFPYSFL